MKEEFTILIADRNQHIRNLLKRELTMEGYRVRLAENCQELIRTAFQPDPLDLIILDPDLPDGAEVELTEKIRNRIPNVPVVIHAFISEYPELLRAWNAEAFVQKSADSLERLIDVVSSLFEKSDSSQH